MNDQSNKLVLIGKETKYFDILQLTFKNSVNLRDEVLT